MWLCWMQFYCSALSLVQIEGCGSVEACVCVFDYWYTFFFVCFFVQAVSRTQLLMYHRHCSATLPDGRIVILGGGGNCFSFGTHLNFTPVVLDISQCLEAVPWEGHHFHQHHSTPGWWGVLGGGGGGEWEGRSDLPFYHLSQLLVLQYMLHISSVAVDVYGIVSHRDFKFKMDAASQQIIRGVHRDFVVVSILTHQASK